MKKEYAVNIESVNSDSDWNTADMANWYESYEIAFSEAEKAFDDSAVIEVVLNIWEDSEICENPLRMVRENGMVLQYQGGLRLWA